MEYLTEDQSLQYEPLRVLTGDLLEKRVVEWCRLVDETLNVLETDRIMAYRYEKEQKTYKTPYNAEE
ncbi:MAG: hypothetical protein GY861_28720 [bacterium]|nr:hypothetical protein [bacterium]